MRHPALAQSAGIPGPIIFVATQRACIPPTKKSGHATATERTDDIAELVDWQLSRPDVLTAIQTTCIVLDMNATEIRRQIKSTTREMNTNPCPAYKARCEQHVAWLRLLLAAHTS